MQSLSYPIVHAEHKLRICDVEIDWSTPWLQQHFRAIVSAYRTSAYFEYYQDELFSIMEKRPVKMFDFNMSVMEFFIRKTGIGVDIRLTEEYLVPEASGDAPYGSIVRRAGGEEMLDLRETIHPKRADRVLESLQLEKPYFQVFSRKYGFIPNLSIMDLLFNEGPDSILFLKKL